MTTNSRLSHDTCPVSTAMAATAICYLYASVQDFILESAMQCIPSRTIPLCIMLYETTSTVSDAACIAVKNVFRLIDYTLMDVRTISVSEMEPGHRVSDFGCRGGSGTSQMGGQRGGPQFQLEGPGPTICS